MHIIKMTAQEGQRDEENGGCTIEKASCHFRHAGVQQNRPSSWCKIAIQVDCWSDRKEAPRHVHVPERRLGFIKPPDDADEGVTV